MSGPEGWDAFWEAWPRKVAKLAAFKAYARALKKKGVTPAKLLAAANAYAAEGRQAQYTLHAASFLNGERFEEYSGANVSAHSANVGSVWEMRLDAFAATGLWLVRWGRKPWGYHADDPRPCEVPADLIERYRPKEKAPEGRTTGALVSVGGGSN